MQMLSTRHNLRADGIISTVKILLGKYLQNKGELRFQRTPLVRTRAGSGSKQRTVLKAPARSVDVKDEGVHSVSRRGSRGRQPA
ncbi:hypothetical protein EVAR_83416_1 [Eumeta japonica]|uniref:Uncharacterized protein n=1 Tax=Eumeta variegata TaxID=151549 RepID=A0A4C1TYF0_EUMVA|nr:hypothetical protein EVAR_83416_1 [Eumeta japonica]